MTIQVFIPKDTTACALGADQLSHELAALADSQGVDLLITRNGSRGAFWLEPLVEVESEAGRVGFANIKSEQLPSLLACMQNDLTEHPACVGLIDALPWFAQQQRLTFSRAGVIDPVSVEHYRAFGGFAGLQKALSLSPQAIVDEVLASGLRGRGGAAFPAGIKWQTVLDAQAPQKYIVCNADEGDSGTFADRLLMEADPYQLLEGMAIAGLAVGATQGYIYLRSEYPAAYRVLCEAIERASEAGFLGADIGGSGRAFAIEVRLGAGAYICGEETSLLNSLEGKRGTVRAKPPLPALEGLFGKPTVVNNVLTLAAASTVLAEGAAFYKNYGMGRSTGTLPFQLGGNIARGGVVELAFGQTLRSLLEDFGGGTRSGKAIKAVQVGGPLGAYVAPELWDAPLDYETYAAAGAMLGHGGVVVHDESADMRRLAEFAMQFCVEESCGKCTPCRIGSTRGRELLAAMGREQCTAEQAVLLTDLCETMELGSLCAMGGMTPVPVLSALRLYPAEFGVEE